MSAPALARGGAASGEGAPAAAARLAPGPRQLLDFLFHVRKTKRRVTPTVEILGKRMGRSPATIRRWCVVLEARGFLVRLYNGGQGLATIYYIGPRGTKLGREKPAWAAETESFGAMRMGDRAIDRRARRPPVKALKNERLTGSHSSSMRGDTPSEYPPLENLVGRDVGALSSGSPPDPPMGGTGDAPPAPPPSPPPEPSPPAGHPPEAPTPAQERPADSRPPSPALAPASPPGGRQAASKGGDRRAPLALQHWGLWCHAWWLWRRYLRARQRQHRRHPADVRAMTSLLASALLRHRGDQDAAARDLAWGFREYVRREPDEPTKPLWVLARRRGELGVPPAGWEAPGGDGDRASRRPGGAADGAPVPKLEPTPGSATARAERDGEGRLGGGRGTKADRARAVLERAEIAHARGLIPLAELERTRKWAEAMGRGS